MNGQYLGQWTVKQAETRSIEGAHISINLKFELTFIILSRLTASIKRNLRDTRFHGASADSKGSTGQLLGDPRISDKDSNFSGLSRRLQCLAIVSTSKFQDIYYK